MTKGKSTSVGIVRSRLKKLAEEFKGTSRSPDDPDAIHDLRVAIRRFNQGLRNFPEVFGGARTRKMRSSLKTVLKMLGTARNVDVAIELVQTMGLGTEGALFERLRASRAEAVQQLATEFKKWQKREALEDWRKRLPKSGSAKALAKLRAELPSLSGKVVDAGKRAVRPGVPYRKMHKFRLHAKHLRYTIEMFAPDYGKELKALKELQDHLGGVNDCVTVLELVGGDRKVGPKIRSLRAQRERKLRAFWNRNHGTLSIASR
jgi:CHAD domain-containing protein